MAVATGFEITSFRPKSLTVVGGGNLKTEYGSYRFNLGLGASGEYHETSCVGMDSVTSKFNKKSAPSSRLFPIPTNLFHRYPSMWGVPKYTYFLESKTLI